MASSRAHGVHVYRYEIVPERDLIYNEVIQRLQTWFGRVWTFADGLPVLQPVHPLPDDIHLLGKATDTRTETGGHVFHVVPVPTNTERCLLVCLTFKQRRSTIIVLSSGQMYDTLARVPGICYESGGTVADGFLDGVRGEFRPADILVFRGEHLGTKANYAHRLHWLVSPLGLNTSEATDTATSNATTQPSVGLTQAQLRIVPLPHDTFPNFPPMDPETISSWWLRGECDYSIAHPRLYGLPRTGAEYAAVSGWTTNPSRLFCRTLFFAVPEHITDFISYLEVDTISTTSGGVAEMCVRAGRPVAKEKYERNSESKSAPTAKGENDDDDHDDDADLPFRWPAELHPQLQYGTERFETRLESGTLVACNWSEVKQRYRILGFARERSMADTAAHVARTRLAQSTGVTREYLFKVQNAIRRIVNTATVDAASASTSSPSSIWMSNQDYVEIATLAPGFTSPPQA